MKVKSMKQRLLSMFLVVIMVVGMIPATALAADDDQTTGAATSIQTVIDNSSASYFLTGLTLHSYDMETGTVGETDFLSGVTAVSDKYTLDLAPGFYQIAGVSKTGSLPMGTLVIEVAEGQDNSFRLVNVYGLRCGNSGWVKDEDYTMEVTVSDQARNMRTFTTGTYNTCSLIALYGDTVEITCTPTEKHPDYLVGTISQTVTTNTSMGAASCAQAVAITVNVPLGSTLSMGTLSSYYVYNFYDIPEPTEVDGKLQYNVAVPKSKDVFYRVQNPNGVTYWNYGKWTAAATINLTDADLYIGDENFNKNTVVKDFSRGNKYDVGNIYVNVNAAGRLDLSVGDSFELNSFRNWFAINSFMNNMVALPDMHYQVIDVNGNASDVITVTPDANNSNVANITAEKNGTAIVLITYDTMYFPLGMGGQAKDYSANWPELTGVVVVNVGGETVDAAPLMERLDGTETPIDSEFDILFYTGDEGANFTFKPVEGASVSVARSTVTNTMTFSGFTTTGVTSSEDGSVTVSGLTAGRHILKIEKDGKAFYQVITTEKTSYEIASVNGVAYTEDTKIKAGDTVRVQFHNLINPKEKLSGAYNFHATLQYQGEEGTKFETKATSSFGVYDFSSSETTQQYIEIKIPKYWSEDTYTLDGAIHMGGFAGVHHRGITYAKGTNPGFNAPNVDTILGALPQLTLDIEPTDFIEGKLTFKDENGNIVDRSKLTVSFVDNGGDGVVIKEDGSFKAVETKYNYVINGAGYEYKVGSVDVVAGTSEYVVTLHTTSENAWDGIATVEPAKDENGVYQVATGAQLAWLAQQVNSKKMTTFEAVLTDDIDLAFYPWTPVNSGGYSYAYKLDGNGHTIVGLNSQKGIFGTIAKGSLIKNLTVKGAVTSDQGTLGGIVGYLQAGTVENCVSEVNITGTGSGKTMAGGIAAYVGNGAVIRNCINKGTIDTVASEVGGICGSTVNANALIENCYNLGSVKGTTRVGGIQGTTGSYAMTVKNCYNKGAVTATAEGAIAGGVAGAVTNGIFENCYNVGTVTGGNGFAGSFGTSAKATKCYALTDDIVAEKLTDADMKSADLGAAFKAVCGDYPALVWQTEAKAHVPAETTTAVAATCTTKGYTAFTCTECKEEFKGEYIPALGHDWCNHADDAEAAACQDCVYVAPTCLETGSLTHTCRREGCTEPKVDVIPATGHTSKLDAEVDHVSYKDCICDVCGLAFVTWADERFANMTLPTKNATISMTDTGSYGWVYDSANNRFKSTNYDKNSTTSESSITFTLADNGALSFNYGVSSESGWDKLTISLNSETIANAISGEQNGTFSRELEAGTYVLKFAYTKDSSSKSGADIGYFSNLVLSVVDRTAEIFAKAKEDAKTTIETIANPADYREAEAAELAKIIAAGLESLNECTTVEEVDFVVELAKSLVAELKTAAQYEAEEYAHTGFETENGYTVYYEHNVKAEGWKEIDGKYYYFAAGTGKMNTKKVITVNGVKYQFNSDGTLVSGTWYKHRNGMRYYYAGVQYFGWHEIDGKTYYFNAKGYLVTGEVEIDGVKYNFDEDGVLLGEVVVATTGWTTEGKDTFYLENGVKVEGWKEIEGAWYYFLPESGALNVKAKRTLNGICYTFDTTTHAAINDGGVWSSHRNGMRYFLRGVQFKNGEYEIDGQTYMFNAKGFLMTRYQIAE